MKRYYKKGFTLAEVLIVIAIIGIIAAVVLHTLVVDVGERINSSRELNISQKITRAVEMMVAKGDYGHFSSTEEFVQALSKYLKIVKICDSDHIADCWPTAKVINAEGEKYEVKNAKTGNDLFTGYLSDNAAFVMADGANIIMSFNPAAPIPTKSIHKSVMKTLPGLGDGEVAYTSEVMAGIDFVMDVNGAEGPNAETESNGTYHDIRSFRKATFSRMSPTTAGQPICSFTYGNLCGYITDSYNPVDCTNSENSGYCYGNTSEQFNYKAGADKVCKDMQMSLTSQAMTISMGNVDKVPVGTYHTQTLPIRVKSDKTYLAMSGDPLITRHKVLCFSYK